MSLNDTLTSDAANEWWLSELGRADISKNRVLRESHTMNINISTNVTRAIAEGRLTPKQINMVARAHAVSSTRGEDYRIQFDRDRGVEVLQNGSPCKASIYIKRQDNTRIFVSRFGNATSQLGLAKFLTDTGA